MAPLDVNPGELSAVGDKLSGDAGALVAALSALTGGILGVNSGHDGADGAAVEVNRKAERRHQSCRV